MPRVLAFLRRHVLPAVVCFGGTFLLMQLTLFERVENLTIDERTRIRTRLGVTLPPDDIALVGIDEISLRDAGRWPWDRRIHTDLMTLLSVARPAVVSWDIMFTEATPQDADLVKAVAANRAVVLGATRAEEDDGVTPAQAEKDGLPPQVLPNVVGDRTRLLGSAAMLLPTSGLATVSHIGFVDTPAGADAVRRSAPLVVRVGDQVYPTLSLRTLMDYWSATPKDVTVKLGEAIVIDAPLAHRVIPIDETGAYYINYRHDRRGFTELVYTGVLAELADRYIEKKPVGIVGLAGRILLVGQVADGLSDFGATPFAPLTPLVLVHANVIENVLQQDYVHVVPPHWIWLGAVVVGVGGLARFSRRKPVDQAIFAVGVPVAFGLAALLGWINGSWIVPVVGPLLGFGALQVYMIGRRMIAELRAKEQIKGMFGSYVSPELVNRLVASGQRPELGGHEEEITAFFSDIQEFSTFSELLPPDRLVQMMNEYLTACTDIIHAEGGTLDKYIGDAIVAMFGAPVPLPDHAYRACVTVVRTQQRIDELRAKWSADATWPEIVGRVRSRVGLNTGSCVIGNMGSRTRFNYTMMGDNVNVAARMESGAKSWGTYAMCTEATRRACEQSGGDRVVFRPLGRIRVKGRSSAVPIHEIVGFREGLPDRTADCIGVFGQALERYYAQDWDAAESLLRRSAALEPLTPQHSAGVKSNPSLVYLELVANLRLHPPGADWDGVCVMKEK